MWESSCGFNPPIKRPRIGKSRAEILAVIPNVAAVTHNRVSEFPAGALEYIGSYGRNGSSGCIVTPPREWRDTLSCRFSSSYFRRTKINDMRCVFADACNFSPPSGKRSGFSSRNDGCDALEASALVRSFSITPSSRLPDKWIF